VEVIYPGAEFPALEDFSLEAGPGEVVAVMGATGCGKSTALKLLLGLAGATRGDIRVDGALFDPVRGLADRAAWAGQSPVVIPGTLYDNIALAHRTASADQVGEAALRAGLPAAALSRPIDERGGGLSGGELRRLALARVLLRDAPLLLLDEPTANLDARSEAELLPVIAAAVRGRTTLIATHSEALAAMADRIVRLAP
jgi:ATP-binding cassette subfamily C protein CydD